MIGASDPLFAATQRALAGQYSLERELGRGGMGVVYLAREVELERLVALKVLPSASAAQTDVRNRFLREARLAASLSHPHIVPIHRVGEAGDIVYFSMAFVDGETVGERLRSRGPLAPSAATRMLREVAQAIAYAHGRDIVHRDIKPDNILLERETGRALVSDFGIAAAPLDAAPDERIMGTAHFMSPEQAGGAVVDARSDLYSLGVVGYLSLSGKFPDPGRSLAEDSPSTPTHLVRAISRAVEVDPAARHATAEMFAEAVEPRAMVRAEVPTPLRQWLDARDPWRLPYIGWSTCWVAAALLELQQSQASDIRFFLAYAGFPLVPAILFQVRHARLVFEAGYTVDDIRAALGSWRREKDAEPVHRPARAERWMHPIARALAWAPIVAFTWISSEKSSPNHAWLTRHPWLWPATFAVGVVSLPILNALGVPVLPQWLGGREKRIASWFWNSRLGRLTERALMWGRRRAVISTAFRPTESVLGSAVDDLYRSLPAAYRDQLSELPGVIERLQAHARHARESLSHLDGVTAVGRDAELSTARDRARRELTESVSALEAVRLDLLRLVGGDADLHPTTTVLQAVDRVNLDLDRLNAAGREVERTVRPLGLDLRPHTPV